MTKPADDDIPDRLIDMGECEPGVRHVAAVKGGRHVRFGHARRCPEGRPLPSNCNLYHVDRRDGRVVGRTRLGNGPAQVASKEYRENYDAIFGTSPTRGPA